MGMTIFLSKEIDEALTDFGHGPFQFLCRCRFRRSRSRHGTVCVREGGTPVCWFRIQLLRYCVLTYLLTYLLTTLVETFVWWALSVQRVE